MLKAKVNTIQVAELPNNSIQFELVFGYTPLSGYIWYCELHTRLVLRVAHKAGIVDLIVNHVIMK